MVKPDRARALEDLIISAFQSGRLRGSLPNGQLSESDLIGLLESISAQEIPTESKIRFQRRRDFLEEDDDF